MADQAGDSLIVAEYLRRKDAGEKVDVNSLVKVYPEQADALRSYLENEAMFSSEAQLSSQFGLGAKGQETTNSMFDASNETIAPRNVSIDGSSKKKTMFGRYRIDKELGAGAMGAVYLAFDTKLERHVALKIPKVMALSGEEFLERFKREAQSAAKLMHPNICQVLDFGEENNLPFITMNFIDGHPLSRFVGTDAYKDQKQVAQTVQTIALALEHAHQNNVIHRDLKPGNVLVDFDGNLSVTDFGLARKLDQSEDTRMTQDGVLLGTPAYMAPEQMEGRQDDVGAQSDIYSLGVILFELLTGEIPFKGTITSIIAQVARDEPPKPSTLRADIDPRLEELCLQMIEKKKDDRPTSMQAVADRLTAWLDSGSPEAKEADEKKKKRLLKYESAKQQIIELLKQGQFSKAIGALEKMSKVKSASVAEYVAWAKKELPNAKAMPKKFKEGIPAVIETAKQLIAKHDYQQAIDILNQLPDDYRNDVVNSLIHQATELQEEADLLLMDLKNAVRKKQYDHIEDNLRRYIEIKPGSRFAKRLWESLQTYTDVPKGKRDYQFDEKGRLQPLLEDSLANPLIKIAVAGVAIFAVTLWGVMSYLNGDSGSQSDQPENTLSPNVASIDSEWIELFNGKDLTGWEYYQSDPIVNRAWKVENRELVLPDRQKNAYLMTSKKYSDFELEFEWMVLKDGNGGVMYRVDKGYEIPYKSGLEYQVLDDGSDIQDKMGQNEIHSAGSLFVIAGSLDKELKPLGEWNKGKIVAIGDHLEHWVNGKKVVDLEIGSPKWFASGKSKNNPNLGIKKSGHIMLQGQETSEHRYRNIRIRELGTLDRNLATVESSPPKQDAYLGNNDYNSIATGTWNNVTNYKTTEDAQGKIKLVGDQFELSSGDTAYLPQFQGRNMIIRAKVKDDTVGKFSLYARANKIEKEMDSYGAWMHSNSGKRKKVTGIGHRSRGKWFAGKNDNKQKEIPSQAVVDDDGFIEFAFAVIDDRLTSYINGEKRFEIINSIIKSGFPAFQLEGEKGIVKDVQVMILDELPHSSIPSPKTTLVPFQNFTTARPLSELNQPNRVNAYPYLSKDGLMIWWTREDFRGVQLKSAIYQAERKNVSSPFTNIKKVLDGYRLASVSPNGLEMISVPVGKSGLKKSLHMTRRQSTSDVFPNPWLIPELTSIGQPKGTFFSADSLSLYICRFSQPAPSFVRASRANTIEPFAKIEPVTIEGNLPVGHYVSWPSITLSGKHLYFSYSESNDRAVEYGAIADATADPNRFVNARNLLLDRERFVTRGGRLCEATSELFYTNPKDKKPYTEMELWVAKQESEVTKSEEQWKDLFNGKDLTGWRHQFNSSKWTVENNELVPQTGSDVGILATDGIYGDFELELEFNPANAANSGVFIRMPDSGPNDGSAFIEIQILDDEAKIHKTLPNSNVTGAIINLAPVISRANVKASQWNKLQVKAIGPKILIRVNDFALIDVDLEKIVTSPKAIRTGLSRNVPRKFGRIGLQSFSKTRVRYRNIRIKELNSSSVGKLGDKTEAGLVENFVSPPPDQDGWIQMFDGIDLKGWRSNADSDLWEVVNGAIVPIKSGIVDVLTYKKEFSDFELKLEFKPRGEGNSGVFIRIPNFDSTVTSYNSLQVQIIDPKAFDGKKKERDMFNGALWRLAPINRRSKVFAYRWNQLKIRALGSKITTWVNSDVIPTLSFDVSKISKAESPHNNFQNKSGFIGLQNEGATQVEFRGIKIRELYKVN